MCLLLIMNKKSLSYSLVKKMFILISDQSNKNKNKVITNPVLVDCNIFEMPEIESWLLSMAKSFSSMRGTT